MDIDLKTRAAEAALALASDRSWHKVTLSAVADRCGVSLDQFYGEASSASLIDLIDEYFDRACAGDSVADEASLRERIFDVAMLRFEVLEDHRVAVRNIRNSWKRRPLARLDAARRRTRTADWILTCVGDDPAGQTARAVVLSGILFRAEEAWENETSPDFTRTMSQLDRDLRDIDAFLRRMSQLKPSFDFRGRTASVQSNTTVS